MRKAIISIALFSLVTAVNTTGYAWKFNTHKASVTDAFGYLEASTDPDQLWIATFLKTAGGDDIANYCGQKNGDTDNFYDTSIGKWWYQYRTHVTIFGIEANYTSFWHFISMFQPGHNGNDYDGFSFRYSLAGGFWNLNKLVKFFLRNQNIRNENFAGENISNPENGAGVIEAYRFQFQSDGSNKSYSTTPDENYDKYQNVIFEPGTNAAAYWYDRALDGQDSTTVEQTHIGYLGHVLHLAGDANVTQHVWDTSDHYHLDYEDWMDSHYAALLDPVRVTQLIDEFRTAMSINGDDELVNIQIRDIIIFFADKAMLYMGPLYSEDETVRLAAGYEEYNGSVAANVLIFEKYVYDLYVVSSDRTY